MWRVILLLVMLIAVSTLRAIDSQALKSEASTTAWACSFRHYVSGFFSDGLKEGSQDMQFTIAAVDLAANSAQIIGGNGAVSVSAYPAKQGVNFIEVTGSGNMHLTTIFFSGASDGVYPAAHSRHSDINGPIPSQNCGFCAPLN